MPYQDQVSQMQGAGFSGQEIQGWSDKQAATMLNAGFSQDEVDGYQGMKAPAPGTPQVYGRVPTDDDFKNAATVILNGDDHPFYEGAVDRLKSMFSDTGVHPETAVKLAQNVPSFQQIMENADNQPTMGEYGEAALRSGVSTVGSGMRGLTEIAAATGHEWGQMSGIPTADQPDLFNPEAQKVYQKGAALQKWIEDKYPVTKAEQNNPIKFGLAGGIGSLVPLVATGGIGMAATGADSAYDEAKKSGASIEQATSHAAKMGPVWGALGVTDVGMFMNPIERAAPGLIPWVVAKSAQAVRSGATFAGTNEFGSWLSKEIGQEAGIPIQYKPTLQRVVINAATGAIAGVARPTSVKKSDVPEPPAEPPAGGGGGEGPPPSSAGGLIAKTAAEKEATGPSAAYHFDTDTYGVKDEQGNFTQTGFKTQAEAEQAMAMKAAPAPEIKEPIDPAVIEKHKADIASDAEDLGFNLTPEQLNQAARLKADATAKPEQKDIEPPSGGGEPPEPPTASGGMVARDDIDHALSVIRSNHKAEAEGPKYPILNWLKERGGIDPNSRDAAEIRAQLGLSRTEAVRKFPQLFVRPRRLSTAGRNKAVGDVALDNIPNSEFPFNPPGHRDDLVDRDWLLTQTENEIKKAKGNIAQDDPSVENVKAEIQQLGLNVKKMSDTEVKFAISKARMDQAREDANNLFGTNLRLSDDESMQIHALMSQGHDISDATDHVLEQRVLQDVQEIIASNKDNEPAGTQAGNEPDRGAVANAVGPGAEGEHGAESGTVAVDTGAKGAGSNDGSAASRVVNEKHLFRLTPEELEKEYAAATKTDREKLVQALGEEKADLFTKLERGANSQDPTRADAAQKKLDELTKDFTDEQDRLVYGIGEAGATPDDIKDIIEAHRLFDFSPDDPISYVARMTGNAMMGADAERVLSIPKDGGSIKDQASLIKITKGIHELKSRGLDDQQIKDALTGGLEAAGASKGDAAEIIGRFIDKTREIVGAQAAKAGSIIRKFLSDTEGSVVLGRSEDKDKVGVLDALIGIRDTVSPTSAGEAAKQTELSIRSAYGQAKRQVAISEEALNEFARDANAMTEGETRDFYRYMEGRSEGKELQNPAFQKMADAIRNIYGQYKGYIEAMPEARQQAFISDYFPHMWEKGQDEKIQQFMTHWQQGSKGHLKEREIPTIEEGLAFGLKLAEPNPVRATSKYIASMSNYIASVNVLRSIHQDLGGGYYVDGKQPEGYTPLVGKNAERIEDAVFDPETGQITPGKNLHLYAPRQVADIYNAFLSKGFEDTKLGPAYMIVRDAINANTMMELGLSAYHLSTITMQSLNQDMSRILRNGLVGDWRGAADAIKGMTVPFFHLSKGLKLVQQYKNLADHGVDMEYVTRLFAQGNMRLGLDPLSNVSQHGFVDAYKRGEIPEIIDRLKSQIREGYGIGALKSGAELLNRTVSTISHPLFKVYIPAIKMSAFHDLMGDWLRQNPGASDAEIAKNTARISNLVESRFGEMNMENVFWNQKAKELLGLTFRAPGWDLGLIQQVGGAGKDILAMMHDAIKDRNFDVTKLDRPLFVAGAVMTYVAMNVAATYIKTGVMPSDQKIKDAIAYATGGVHKAFGMHPERGELPGHGRELIQMAPVPGEGMLSGVEQEIGNKVASLPKNIYEAATNRDWKGKPIYDPKSNSWVQRTPGLAQVAHIAKGFEPFAMESLLEGKPPGSNLSFAERFLGVRPAGAKIVAPQELKAFNERHH